MDFSKQARAERCAEIFTILEPQYPRTRPHLNYENPFQLLVATMLAAQCTDEMVNRVTPELFRLYPDPARLAASEPSELEAVIKSTGFYRNKARSLREMSRALQERFGGRLPEEVERLTELPGVGRKTANVVAGHCYGKPAIIVDTHFKRVCGRLGLSREKDPDKIELDLAQIVAERNRTRFSMVINEHGRRICAARQPLCGQCLLRALCPYPEEPAEA